MDNIELKLYWSRKLNLEQKSRNELCLMRDHLQYDSYKKICDFFHMPTSKNYQAKLDVIQLGFERI
jgi:hypothetical protein